MANKKPGTARTTISLPPALKKRMDQVAEQVNWSAIAAAAFEQKLAEIAARKETKSMSDVVERLRGSKRKSDTAECAEGEAAGREWAMRTAEAIHLERLEEFYEGLRVDEEESVFDPGDGPYSGAEIIFFAIEPQREKDRQGSRDFWEGVLGEEKPKKIYCPEFLRGFVQGALDLWDEVQDQL